jgi:hypothetical protein
MALRLGSSTPSKLYLGATEVTKAYLGASEVYSSVAAAWTPAYLGASLALWLDADDASTITLNGSTVSQWNDKSGNKRNVSRATAANQPTYTASGLNGKPVITFDGTNDSLINASAGLMRAVSGATSVIVMSRAANLAAASDLLWIGMSTGNARLVMSFRIGLAAPGEGFTSGGRRLSTDSFQTVTGFAYTSNPIIAAARHDYANANLEIWQDGTAGASRVYQTAGVTDNNAGELSVGAGNTAGTGAPLNGYIAEITLVHSALSTTDRQKLEGYLAHKWGLTANLPADHPYKTTPPTV